MKSAENRIWDRVRLKWVATTPEEQVRAAVVDYLIDHCGVLPQLMATEFTVKVSGRRLRADIIVFAMGSIEPLLVVECKAPHIDINEKVMTQACAYNSMLGARFIMLTNGEKTYAYDTLCGVYIKDIRGALNCKSDK